MHIGAIRPATTAVRRCEMLILTRRINESLIVGDDVKVTVLSVKGKQIKLGVTAPREIAVHREEIYQRIQQENARGSYLIKNKAI